MSAQIITDGEFIEGGDTLDPDLNQSFYDFIDQIKGEANSGGSIAVFQVPTDANGMARPNTLRKPKLFTVPVGQCTLDDICDRVLREFVEPGGEILIQLLGRQDGKRGNRLNQLIPLRRGKATDNKSDGTTSGEVAQMMRMMNEQRAQDRAEMRALFENRGASVDPMTQGLAIAKEITGMAIAARNGVVPGAAVPVNDPNTMMNQMMGMMLTRMFKKMMDGEDKPAAPENTSWLKDIVELAKPLLEAKAAAEKTNAAREQRLLRHEAAPPVPAPPPNTEAPAKEPTIQEQNDMKLFAVLESGLPQIIEHGAAKNSPADILAKIVMDELPEDDAGLNDAFFQLIQSPKDEFLAKLAVVDARVKEFPEWFESFRLALLGEFDPDERAPQVQGVNGSPPA